MTRRVAPVLYEMLLTMDIDCRDSIMVLRQDGERARRELRALLAVARAARAVMDAPNDMEMDHDAMPKLARALDHLDTEREIDAERPAAGTGCACADIGPDGNPVRCPRCPPAADLSDACASCDFCAHGECKKDLPLPGPKGCSEYAPRPAAGAGCGHRNAYATIPGVCICRDCGAEWRDGKWVQP